MRVSRNLNSIPISGSDKVRSGSIHRTHRVHTRRGTARRLPSPPIITLERAETYRDHGVFRQRTLVGDPLDDEERSNDLSNPSSISQPVRTLQSRESTHLSLKEDGHEYLRRTASSNEQSNHQQRAHGIDDAGFNKHGDDCPAQPASSSPPQRSTSVPGIQNESDDNHEGEEDVE